MLSSRIIDSAHSRSRIAASKFGCSFVPVASRAHVSKPGCHAAAVHGLHRKPSNWFFRNPITTEIQGRTFGQLYLVFLVWIPPHHGPPQSLYGNCAKSISNIKTRHVAIPHSKSTIARSLSMTSLTATRTQRHMLTLTSPNSQVHQTNYIGI